MLGGIGLERVVAISKARTWRLLRVPAAFALVLAGAAAIVALSNGAPNEVRLTPAWPWLPWLSIAGLAAVALAGACVGSRAALATGLTVVAIDLLSFTGGAVQTVQLEPAETVARWMGPPTSGRAVSVCENRIGVGEMFVNHQANVDGPAGMHLGAYADWAYLAKFGDPPPGDGMFRRVGSEGLFPARRDLLDLANVSTVFACQPIDVPSLTLVSTGRPVLAYRNETAWPRAFWTCEGQAMSRAAVTQQLLQGRYDHDRRLLRRHPINVRWAPGVGDDRRRAVEKRYKLLEGVQREDTTWRYMLADVSPANAIALIQDAAVDDTEGLDRGTGEVVVQTVRMPGRPTGADELLITGACAERGEINILTSDQPDGRVLVDVNAPDRGFVFLSEPYYSERVAFVDGERVTPVKANLAFTAVPVPPGRHQIELRHVPASFYRGAGTSALTLTVWMGLLVTARGRERRSETAIPHQSISVHP
jgi:hypothetical protein